MAGWRKNEGYGKGRDKRGGECMYNLVYITHSKICELHQSLVGVYFKKEAMKYTHTKIKHSIHLSKTTNPFYKSIHLPMKYAMKYHVWLRLS